MFAKGDLVTGAHTVDFETELHVPAQTVVVSLFILGAAMTIMALLLSLDIKFAFFAVLLYGLAGLVWGLDQSHPRLAHWSTVIGLTILVALADTWLAVPGALAMLAIPVAVGAAVIGPGGAVVAGAGASVLLAALARRAGTGIDLAVAGVPLALIWATVGILAAIYEREAYLAGWSWQQFRRAQALLEETRDRRAELHQALQELAAANLQLTRLNQQAQALRQMAEEARRTKEEFVANVSHELRTPLNMIVGFSEMILEAPDSYGHIPPALLADLAVIQRNSQHLSSLIDDVLDLSQIEAGRAALVKERVELGEIIEAAAIAVRPLYETKGLWLETDRAEGVQLYCDRTRIREVLLNLLINAGRFTEQGGVRVQARQQAGDIIVSVTDTGPGIAAEDQKELFQPFHQVDSSIRRRYGGTGLGLNISKSFVEMHGGAMWVESERGHGATFSFRLPQEPPAPIAGGVARWLTPGWEHVQRTQRPLLPAPVVKARMVVLERGKSLQKLLSRHLDGVEIATVAGYEEAIEELARTPAQALLVNEPSIGNALERLNNLVGLPQGMPAIVCSVPDAGDAAGALGAEGYLVNPISREALLEALDRLCPHAKTVLIVDDEPDAQRLFRRMLVSTGRGYHVLRAMDGRHALNILREKRPDVMLVDLVMPEMDGFKLLAAKSADPELRNIPALVTSARDPAGQPIVTSAVAITQQGGLSVQQLLDSIEALTRLLSPEKPVGEAHSNSGS